MVVLHGISGAGKTWLAQSFADEQSKERQVYWIGGSPLASYRTLVQKLGLMTEQELQEKNVAEEVVCRVHAHFEQYPDSLLVFDDVSESDLYLDCGEGDSISLIPEGSAQVLVTRVLLTSRSDLQLGHGPDIEAEFIQVDSLLPKESTELLRKILKKPADEKQLNELAELLFHHPLLLSMTAGYLAQISKTNRLQSLDDLIEGELVQLRKDRDHIPEGSREHQILAVIQTRWDKNLKAACEEESRVAECLGICGYLSPTNIQSKWLEEENLSEAVSVMDAYGFCQIHRDQQGSSLNMHMLVQQMSRRADTSKDYFSKAIGLFSKAWKRANSAERNLWYPHLDQLADQVATSDIKKHKAAGVLWSAAAFWKNHNNQERSRHLLDICIERHLMDEAMWDCLPGLLGLYKACYAQLFQKPDLTPAQRKVEETLKTIGEGAKQTHPQVFYSLQKLLGRILTLSEKPDGKEIEKIAREQLQRLPVKKGSARYFMQLESQLEFQSRARRQYLEKVKVEADIAQLENEPCSKQSPVLAILRAHLGILKALAGDMSSLKQAEAAIEQSESEPCSKQSPQLAVFQIELGLMKAILGDMSSLEQVEAIIKQLASMPDQQPILLWGGLGIVKARSGDKSGIEQIEAAIEQLESEPCSKQNPVFAMLQGQCGLMKALLSGDKSGIEQIEAAIEQLESEPHSKQSPQLAAFRVELGLVKALLLGDMSGLEQIGVVLAQLKSEPCSKQSPVLAMFRKGMGMVKTISWDKVHLQQIRMLVMQQFRKSIQTDSGRDAAREQANLGLMKVCFGDVSGLKQMEAAVAQLGSMPGSKRSSRLLQLRLSLGVMKVYVGDVSGLKQLGDAKAQSESMPNSEQDPGIAMLREGMDAITALLSGDMSIPKRIEDAIEQFESKPRSGQNLLNLMKVFYGEVYGLEQIGAVIAKLEGEPCSKQPPSPFLGLMKVCFGDVSGLKQMEAAVAQLESEPGSEHDPMLAIHRGLLSMFKALSEGDLAGQDAVEQLEDVLGQLETGLAQLESMFGSDQNPMFKALHLRLGLLKAVGGEQAEAAAARFEHHPIDAMFLAIANLFKAISGDASGLEQLEDIIVQLKRMPSAEQSPLLAQFLGVQGMIKATLGDVSGVVQLEAAIAQLGSMPGSEENTLLDAFREGLNELKAQQTSAAVSAKPPLISQKGSTEAQLAHLFEALEGLSAKSVAEVEAFLSELQEAWVASNKEELNHLFICAYAQARRIFESKQKSFQKPSLSFQGTCYRGTFNQYSATNRRGELWPADASRSSCTVNAVKFLSLALAQQSLQDWRPDLSNADPKLNIINRVVDEGREHFGLILKRKKEAHEQVVAEAGSLDEARATSQLLEQYGGDTTHVSEITDLEENFSLTLRKGFATQTLIRDSGEVSTVQFCTGLLEQIEEELREERSGGAIFQCNGLSHSVAMVRRNGAMEYAIFDSHGSFRLNGHGRAFVYVASDFADAARFLGNLILFQDVGGLPQSAQSELNQLALYVYAPIAQSGEHTS